MSDTHSQTISVQDRIDAFLSHWIVAWVALVMRHARISFVLILVTTVALLGYTINNLRINSDAVSLIAEDLPARLNHEAFTQLFPNLENALFVVIDAKTPELSRQATLKLGHRMRRLPEFFSDVYVPGGGSFFERNGLLYQSPDQLDEFADQMAQVQPLIAALDHDPSLQELLESHFTLLVQAAKRFTQTRNEFLFIEHLPPPSQQPMSLPNQYSCHVVSLKTDFFWLPCPHCSMNSVARRRRGPASGRADDRTGLPRE